MPEGRERFLDILPPPPRLLFRQNPIPAPLPFGFPGNVLARFTRGRSPGQRRPVGGGGGTAGARVISDGFRLFRSVADQLARVRVPVRPVLGRVRVQHQLRQVRTRLAVHAAVRRGPGLRRPDQEVQLARRARRPGL